MVELLKRNGDFIIVNHDLVPSSLHHNYLLCISEISGNYEIMLNGTQKSSHRDLVITHSTNPIHKVKLLDIHKVNKFLYEAESYTLKDIELMLYESFANPISSKEDLLQRIKDFRYEKEPKGWKIDIDEEGNITEIK